MNKMHINANSGFYMELIELEEFLREPPSGFKVEVRGSGYRFVRYDPGSFCVFIDECNSAKGKVLFQHSPGRIITVHSLKDYTDLRKRLTSQLIFILVSVCELNPALKTKSEKAAEVLQQFIVVINGRNPVVKWEIERGLDQAISSVAGESYAVQMDVEDALQSWADKRGFEIPLEGRRVKPLWQHTNITLRYHSDALFDFPFWLGLSKRKFTLEGELSHVTSKEKQEKTAEEGFLSVSLDPDVQKKQ
ncbi:mesenteric estrogen-dependent adipogenesis protein [Lepisosteus oculatus]|uniref:mesenteric estrogen-dependent adipogenesis protein n=1 Tax=Lepisosteus oculatus TaxID=7918 RepID=UPI0037178D95